MNLFFLFKKRKKEEASVRLKLMIIQLWLKSRMVETGIWKLLGCIIDFVSSQGFANSFSPTAYRERIIYIYIYKIFIVSQTN